MNILNVVGSFPPAWRGGGVPLISHALTVTLIEKGCSVLTIADNSNEGVRMDVPVGQLTEWEGAPVIYVDRFVSFPQYAKSLYDQVALHADSADMMIARGQWRPHNWAVRKIGVKKAIPYLLFPDGTLDPWAWQHRKLKKQLFWTLIERKNYRHAACVIAMHTIEIQQVLDKISGVRVEPVPSGVYLPNEKAPLDKVSVQQLVPGLEEKDWIISMARIDPKKGIDVLIKGFARFSQQYPHIRLVIAGEGDPDYVQQLHTLADSHGIADKLLWPGLVKDELKDGLLRYATVFTLTSHSEGLPTGALEALSYRLPVIVTPYCNFPEIETFDAGLIIEPDPDQVTEALEMLFTDLERSRSMGQNGYRLVADHYSWSSVADRILNICEDIMVPSQGKLPQV
jgi:glycosyltransferase involved in cell wall biosynthesis